MARFKRHVLICENIRDEDHPRGSCGRKNSAAVRERFKQELKRRGMTAQYRANKSGCLDACEFGPVVVVYPDAVWYGGVREEDVEEIVERHIVGGEPVERLQIQDRRYQQEF